MRLSDSSAGRALAALRMHQNADIYAGTAVRTLASQLRHHAGVVDFASALSAEVARSQDHDLWDLLPTSRFSIAYRYDWTTYVIHPDASLTLEYEGDGVHTCWSSSDGPQRRSAPVPA